MKHNIFSIVTYIALLTGLVACNTHQEVRVEQKQLQQVVFASGHLEQEDEYVIAPSVDGTIQNISVREGDSVSAGQQLVTIKNDVPNSHLQEAQLVYEDARRSLSPKSPEFSQLESQIAMAETQLDIDRENYERYYTLAKKNSVSKSELEKATLQLAHSQTNLDVLQKNYKQLKESLQLNAARSMQQLNAQHATLAEYTVKADKAGLALDVLKKNGELVKKGEIILKLGSGKFKLKLFIAEEDITRLNIGQEALVQMNNYPDTTFQAKITRILPAFDQASQSYIAEAEFTKAPPLLLSGTQLQANIKQNGIKTMLVIPSNALIRGHYVQLQNGTERIIQTGQKLENWIEVKSGLKEGDIIRIPKSTNKKQGVQLPGTE
jgi:multidrug efflux pump subunit AcrA (membrane-fusion protein)